MSDPSLIVPIHVDALVANRGVLSRDGEFRWWPYNYQALQNYKSPEPEAGGRQVGKPSPGVYLHWTLPRSLREGAQVGDDIVYPRVPNRWLVVRTHGEADGPRTLTAWVIESDCPLTDAVRQTVPGVDVAQMSMYLVDPSIVEAWKASADPLRAGIGLDPASTEPNVANIGVRFPLAEGWEERSPETTFLTAVAPGNTAFSAYYPHHVGVFSMYDDVAGIDAATLSYQVVGWYSNPADDILAAWVDDDSTPDPYGALLERLGWSLEATDEAGEGGPDLAGSRATRSLYEGLAFSIPWDRDGEPPLGDPLEEIRESGTLNVALGNNTIDAFTALIGEQLEAAGYPTQTVELLRAFQYDLLPVMNEPNGEALLAARIRQEWFGSEPGGYAWDIVGARDRGDDEPVELTPDEAAWLSRLNRDQQALDAALGELFDLQWWFNATWWKLGLDPDGMFPQSPPGVTNAKLQAFLDPANPNGITARVLAKYREVDERLAAVPRPLTNGSSPEDAFQRGVQAFAAAKGLGDGKVLKAVTAPRFWMPNNPAVVVSGVEPPPAMNPSKALAVRTASALVSAFTVDDHTVDTVSVGGALPTLPDPAPLPPEAPALVTEFLLLDPASAPAIAGALGLPPDRVAEVMRDRPADSYASPLPARGLDVWAQPWQPLYLEWKVRYTHIPYRTGERRNWVFDGVDYRYDPGAGAPATEDRQIGGISPLGPHAQFVFGARLKEFLAKYPDADLGQLDEWIDEIDGWKFLTQELTGLNELLALRDPRTFRRPGPSDTVGDGAERYIAADLAGFPTGDATGDTVLPRTFQSQVGTVPYLPNGPSVPFHGVRQGQLYFEELSLYDVFGRRLWVIESSGDSGLFDAKNFPLVRDRALLPDHPVHPRIAAVAEFPPRLLQHARLDFRLVDGKDDERILGRDGLVNPIAGWVLPNHLDRGLLLYAPDGMGLGELRLVAREDGGRTGEWRPPPHGEITTLDDVARVAPHLHEMITSQAIQTQVGFEAFLHVIDQTLWTIDPLGGRADQNLSVLVGRPLALVRARLQLRPNGPPIRDAGWGATFDPPEPEFAGHRFGVRLGDQATRQDGVIGYFTGDDYDMFNSVASPLAASGQEYVRQIGPVGRPDGGNYLELRLDERSAVFVTILADPRAAMHAITGILPYKRVEIPTVFVDRALRDLEVGFRLGPILTRVGPTPVQAGTTPAHPDAIALPAPAEQNGNWSWWEPGNAGGADWTGYDLVPSTSDAELDGQPVTLRDGVLQLVIDLDKPT